MQSSEIKLVDNFFYPKSVAIIGASHTSGSVGYTVLENFIRKFQGNIYPINPNVDFILGKKCEKSISNIKEKIDLGVICVPAKIVPRVFEECGKKKVPAVIVISAGFNEVGNIELTQQLIDLIQKYKKTTRVIGPNCLGVLNCTTKVDTLFLPEYRLARPRCGTISFISQSGAIGSAVLDWASSEGYGMGKLISYGNALDLDETDLMEYLVQDENTDVICIYLEGNKNGRKFFESLKKVSHTKPIIVLKGGRSQAGAKATASHTASMAGSHQVFQALYKQTGLIEAKTFEELFNFARVLSKIKTQPKGNRVQIITDGGGYGVLLADALEECSLQLAEMSKECMEEIRKNVPPYVQIKNPLDLAGDVTNERYKIAIEQALLDKNVDMVAVIILFQVPQLDSKIVEVIKELNNKKLKPLIVISIGGQYSQVHVRALEEAGVITFAYPEEAAESLQALWKFYEYKKHISEKMVQKKTILYVDDSTDEREIMSARLERRKYDVVSAEHPKEAIRILRSGRIIDAIVTDIVFEQQPHRQRDGAIGTIDIGHTEDLINLARRNGIPSIIFTGMAIDETRRRKLGVPIVIKPNFRGELFSKIKTLIRNTRRRSQVKFKPVSLRALEGILVHILPDGRQEIVEIIRRSTSHERELYALGKRPLTRATVTHQLWHGMQPGNQEHSKRTLDRLMRTRETLLAQKSALPKPKRLRKPPQRPRLH